MQYIIASAEAAAAFARLPGLLELAAGDPVVFEGPWPLGRTTLFYAADRAALGEAQAVAASDAEAYAVAGMAEPGDGKAYAIAAHMMLDPQGFRPYADSIHDMLTRFGVRSLARAGKVTPLGGRFTPERAVVLEFADLDAARAFYCSEEYAPLLRIRLNTTDPRFIMLGKEEAAPLAREQMLAAVEAAQRVRNAV